MQQTASPSRPKKSQRKLVLTVCAVILSIPIVIGMVLFWTYGTDTHHSSRNTIWWTERGRNLIPPAATDITLRQDFLDHYATYTISTTDLNAFLLTLDPDSKLSPDSTGTAGKVIGNLGWIAPKHALSGSYIAGNGGVHSYYHDPKTGLTYQESAYW